MKKIPCLACLATIFTLESVSALHIRSYNAGRHERFSSFGTAANAGFMHAGVDLSGVGWDVSYIQRQVTLISPQHFVCANHFRPPVGGEIRFLSSGGVARSAIVQSLTTIPNASGQPTDVLIGRLTAPMAANSGVKFLPCHILDTEAAYTGQTLGVLGQFGRGGSGTIGGFQDFGGDPITGGSGINATRALRFTYNSITGGADDAYAEGGDSGSPSFVVVNGKAAVTGTHTAVLSVAGTMTTFDSFLPAYVTPVNAVLEADGYHLTAAAPKATALSLTQQAGPAVLRAGYPASITYTLTNTGATAAANNVRLDIALPGTSAISATGAAGWIFTSDGGTLKARRGGLAAGTATTVTVTFTPEAAGTVQSALTRSADETAAVSTAASLTVLGSFRSWSQGLTDPSPAGDDDHDGESNLMEYSFGGDPAEASPKVKGTTQDMGPAAVRTEPAGSGAVRQVIRYTRRTDAAARQLEYRVEVNSDLGDAWQNVSAGVLVLSTTPVTSGFELVEMALPAAPAQRQFVRVRAVLHE